MPLLRVTCPAELTERLVGVLRTEASATAISVLPGASRLPAGDLILAEVPRTAVDVVVERLHDAHAPAGVQVSIEPSESLLSARRPQPGDDDAVVWSQVVQDLQDVGRLSWVNVALIVIAACIAALGIIQDQLLLIVGAMALSPDYFPVADTCLSLARGAWDRAARGLVTLAICFGAAIAGALVLTEVLDRTGLITADGAPSRELTSFIAQPSSLSVVVALFAGVAGALAVTVPDSRGLVGVFVSITTIPAAANIGVALSAADGPELWGASVQLVINVISLLVMGTITLDLRHRLSRPPRA